MTVLIMLMGAGIIYFIVENLYVRFWNKNLEADINFSKAHVIQGDSLEIVETISNGKYLPLPYVYLKFQLDRAIAFSENDGNSMVSDKVYRNDIFSLLYYQRVTRRITVQCVKRGVYTIGRIDLVSTGAFMKDTLAVSFESPSTVTVYPKVLDVHRLTVPFSQLMGMIERNSHFYEDPFVFRGIRDYESFDSMKQVNWKATARTGSLMVNQYNETICQEVCILLNLEPEGMLREELISEESISLAAGLAQMFVEQGISVALVSNGRDSYTQEEVNISAGGGVAHINVINTALARINLLQPMQEFYELIQQLEVKKDTGNVLYVLISENKRKNLLQAYEKLCLKSGMWIVPFMQGAEVDLRESLTGINGNIEVLEWEVKRDGR